MTTPDWNRLEKFMALFDAADEGERHAALGAANRFLAGHGLTWRALMVAPRPPKAAKPAPAPTPEPEYELCECEDCCRDAAAAMELHADFHTLGDRHCAFVLSINTKWKDRQLSDRQRVYVLDLADRLGVPRKRTAERKST